MEKINLTINGQKVEIEKGATILEAAQAAGIYVPTLCHDPDLEPYGSCRLCIVEIDGLRGFPTSCTTPATDGMVVRTETPALNEVRRTVLDLLISDHPMDCLTCVKNQRCELQKVAAYLGITERRLPRIEKNVQVDDSNPFFKLDRNYCILCARCVRACDEVTMVNAIDLIYRGFATHVGTFGDKPFMESICRSCGECVVRCPVAALVPKQTTMPTQEVLTTCAYCGVGCTMYLGTRGGQIVSVRGDRNNPASKGRLCVKGRYGSTEYVTHPDRLTSPLIKKNGEFVRATWDEALGFVAEKLATYKPEEVAVISSAKCTNEENYLMQKFSRAVLGTHSIDHCARL
jgi:predicted molibdopterin-dependent oxidoreductase YjgC